VPPLRTIAPAVSKPLEDVIFRALAKTPGDRFPSMEDFAAALQAPEAASTSAKAAAQTRTSGWKKMVSGFFTRG
jgi:hypothetical protein